MKFLELGKISLLNFEVQTICYHFPSPGSTSQPLPRLVGASSHARWPVGGAAPHAGSRWLSQHGHRQAKRRTGRLPPFLFKSRSASPNPNSLLFLHYHRHLELLPHFRTPIHHLRYSRYPLDSMHNLLLLSSSSDLGPHRPLLPPAGPSRWSSTARHRSSHGAPPPCCRATSSLG